MQVFTHEILKDPEEACTIAKNAFDEGLDGLKDLNERQYRDSTLLMQVCVTERIASRA